MADRTVALIVTPREEKALAHLVGWACANLNGREPDHTAVRSILKQAGSEQIGRINSALNANK